MSNASHVTLVCAARLARVASGALFLTVTVTSLAAACGGDASSGPEAGGGADAGALATTDAGAAVVGDAARAPDASDAGLAPDPVPVGELFGFVGSGDGTIRVYDVDDATGAWTLKKENSGTTAAFLAFDPKRRHVVAVTESGANGLVRGFSFDPSTGALTPQGDRPAGGAGTTHVSFHPSGDWVFVANYTGGTTSVLPVDQAGALGAATDTKSSGQKSHWAGTDRSGAHVFVPALGDNVIAQYVFDAQAGKLMANGSASLPAGAGPRHVAFHPTSAWAYAVNELAVSVTTFDLGTTSGTLTAKQTVSALPAAQSATGVTGAEIVVHPSGKFVYVSTRKFNSIAAFAIGADGTLTRIANAPTGNDVPRSFDIDPEGTLLFAANQDAAEIVGYRIDADSGTLAPLGKVAGPAAPTFVGLARIP